MPSINLMGPTNEALSKNIGDQENLNIYSITHHNGRGGRALIGCMGSAQFSNGSIGLDRGAHPRQIGDYAYFVGDTNLYRLDSDGVATSLGTVPGTNPVSIVFDGTSLIIFNGTSAGYYYNTSTGIFSSVTLPANAYVGTTLDTYVVFVSDNSRWYASNASNSDAWDVLDFASVNKSNDALLAIHEDHSELMLFCERHIEPWFNSSDVDFPFEQNTAGIIERGTSAKRSIAKEDNTLFFLGDDFIVYRLQGYQPIRISTDGIESKISKLKTTAPDSIAAAFAITYIEHGHKFYQLTFPGQFTVCFNIATGEWHTMKHWNLETHHATSYCYAFDKHLIGTLINDGNIYEMSREYFEDHNSPLKRARRTQIISSNDRLIKFKKLKFIMEFGTTQYLSGSGSDPLLMLRWSDTFGRTPFENERHLRLGGTGDFLGKAIKRNCGSSRARVFEIAMTDPAPFVMIDAIAETT